MRSRRITPRIICPDRCATPASGASRMPGRKFHDLGVVATNWKVARSGPGYFTAILGFSFGGKLGHPECSRPAMASRRTATSEASLPAGRLQTRQLHRAHQHQDDLLWRNTSTGMFSIWQSTGTGFTPNVEVGTSGPTGPSLNRLQSAGKLLPSHDLPVCGGQCRLSDSRKSSQGLTLRRFSISLASRP
jgi:hypothetical protein